MACKAAGVLGKSGFESGLAEGFGCSLRELEPPSCSFTASSFLDLADQRVNRFAHRK